MCEQCITNMLAIGYSDGQDARPMTYIGLARKAADWAGYTVGDVTVGQCDDPDFRYSGGLFTRQQWEEVRKREAEDEDYVENGPVDYFYDRGAEEMVEGTSDFPSSIATSAVLFCKDFPFDWHTDSFRGFGLHFVTAIADLFTRIGIPLDKEGRAQWVSQFPREIQGLYWKGESFELYYTFGRPAKEGEDEDGFHIEEDVLDWVPGQPIVIPGLPVTTDEATDGV